MYQQRTEAASPCLHTQRNPSFFLSNVTHTVFAFLDVVVGGGGAALHFFPGMCLKEFSSTYITPLLIKRAPRQPPVHPACALAANFCAVDLSICNKLLSPLASCKMLLFWLFLSLLA